MEKNTHQNNGYGNGFILGLIVGVIVTLLFTTKRGRMIAKEIMDKGIQKFANLEELMEESKKIPDDEEDFEDDNDYIPAEPIQDTNPPEEKPQPTHEPKQKEVKPVKEAPVQQQHVKEPTKEKETAPEKSKTTGKRWFRGLRKKS